MIFQHENDFDGAIRQVMAQTGQTSRVPFLKGIIATESSFNPAAMLREKNDASYGLTQILGATAASLGHKGKPEDLLRPETNLYYSALLLKTLFSRFNSEPAVAAAWNMGRPRLAAESTPIIQGIWGAPKADWTYANQPYVDKVLTYAAYFTAVEKGDVKTAALFEDAAKKKDSQPDGTCSSGTTATAGAGREP